MMGGEKVTTGKKKGKSAREGTLEPEKKTARETTHAPLQAEAIRRKDGEFRTSGRKRRGGRQ